jgi:D-3-phosphoglycerate dehydrogenase
MIGRLHKISYTLTVEELFASCTYISIHVPKTKETQGLVNADRFGKAKKGLVLINTVRGGIVNETALYEAMKDGTVRAVAFDVFENEPLSPDSPLLSMPGFIATPHYAGSTEECLQRVATACARETAAALFGEENPEYQYL